MGVNNEPTEEEVSKGWAIVLNACGCPAGSGRNPAERGLYRPCVHTPQRRAYTAALSGVSRERERELWYWAKAQPSDPDGWAVGQVLSAAPAEPTCDCPRR